MKKFKKENSTHVNETIKKIFYEIFCIRNKMIQGPNKKTGGDDGPNSLNKKLGKGVMGLRDLFIENRVTPFQNQLMNIFYQTIYAYRDEEKLPQTWGGYPNIDLLSEIIALYSESPELHAIVLDSINLFCAQLVFSKIFIKGLPMRIAYFMTIPEVPLGESIREIFKGRPKEKKHDGDLSPDRYTILNNIIYHGGFILGAEIDALVPSTLILCKASQKIIKITEELIKKGQKSGSYKLTTIDESKKPDFSIITHNDGYFFVPIGEPGISYPLSGDDITKIFSFFKCTPFDITLKQCIEFLIKYSSRTLEDSRTNAFNAFINADPLIFKYCRKIETSDPLDNKMNLPLKHPEILREYEISVLGADLTGKEINRIRSDLKIIGFIHPNPSNKRTLIMIHNNKQITFNAIIETLHTLINTSASCLEFPYTRVFHEYYKTKPQYHERYTKLDKKYMDSELPLQYWTQEELDRLAMERGVVNIPEWTEEELEQLKYSRNLVQIEEWTEEELNQLNKLRNLPSETDAQYYPDDSLIECPECGYALQKDWEECPICGYKIDHSELKEAKLKNHENDDNEYWKPPEP